MIKGGLFLFTVVASIIVLANPQVAARNHKATAAMKAAVLVVVKNMVESLGIRCELQPNKKRYERKRQVSWKKP